MTPVSFTPLTGAGALLEETTALVSAVDGTLATEASSSSGRPTIATTVAIMSEI
jgi:hypothetical protein